MKDNDSKITAKELANLMDETYYTIDHWTNMQLLKVVEIRKRTRYYNKKESIKRCKKIRELQNQRLPLEVIARELEKV